MSIRVKISGMVFIVFIVLFASLFYVSRSVLLDSFATLEARDARQNVQRVMNAIADEAANLSLTAADWGHWTDTYLYLQGEYNEYIDDNFPDDNLTLINLNTNFVALSDADGEIVFSKALDLESGEATDLPEGLDAYFRRIPELGAMQGDNLAARVSGLVALPDSRLFVVGSVGVLTNERQGPLAGTLSFGRVWDEAKIASLSESLRLSVQLQPLNGQNSDIVEALLAGEEGEILVRAIDNDTLGGYTILPDVGGQGAALLGLELPREIYLQGQNTVSLLALVLVLTGVLLSFVTLVLLERIVIHRVAALSSDVATIHEDEGLNRRVVVNADDELTHLGQSINTMLDRLKEAQTQLNDKNIELEKAYEQAREATRLKSEFLSMMSHELRTPLNAMIGYSGIMMEGIGGELDADAMRMVGNIYDSSKHLLSLVNDILDLSKVESGRMELADVDFSLRDMVNTIRQRVGVLATNKKLDFNTQVADDVPDRLRGDHDRLSQVVTNLLSNAFKFTDTGAVDLLINRQDETLRIEVRDTGSGIPAHELPHIFEEFRQVDGSYRKPYEGTGLGLAIVRRLCAAMGGSIIAKSTLGQGSSFIVSLPLKLAQQEFIVKSEE